jgi:hypothetical protein
MPFHEFVYDGIPFPETVVLTVGFEVMAAGVVLTRNHISVTFQNLETETLTFMDQTS